MELHDRVVIVTGGGDKTARVWETATGEEIRRLEGHRAGVGSVAFSADGRFVLTGSGDKTARLWDAHDGSMVRRFERRATALRGVAFAPNSRLALSRDGRHLVTANANSTVYIFRLAAYRPKK